MVCNYIQKKFRWGVSDFIKALAFSGGPVNAYQKTAFAAAAYKDSEVLKSYFANVVLRQDSGRETIIEALDLGNNELRKRSGKTRYCNAI